PAFTRVRQVCALLQGCVKDTPAFISQFKIEHYAIQFHTNICFCPFTFISWLFRINSRFLFSWYGKQFEVDMVFRNSFFKQKIPYCKDHCFGTTYEEFITPVYINEFTEQQLTFLPVYP